MIYVNASRQTIEKKRRWGELSKRSEQGKRETRLLRELYGSITH